MQRTKKNPSHPNHLASQQNRIKNYQDNRWNFSSLNKKTTGKQLIILSTENMKAQLNDLPEKGLIL